MHSQYTTVREVPRTRYSRIHSWLGSAESRLTAVFPPEFRGLHVNATSQEVIDYRV
jgi:hypothetical protein